MPTSRTKSCQQCRLAKARCSLSAPCTRCSKRGQECLYTPVSTSSGHNSARARGLRTLQPAARTTEGAFVLATPAGSTAFEENETADSPAYTPALEGVAFVKTPLTAVGGPRTTQSLVEASWSSPPTPATSDHPRTDIDASSPLQSRPGASDGDSQGITMPDRAMLSTYGSTTYQDSSLAGGSMPTPSSPWQQSTLNPSEGPASFRDSSGYLDGTIPAFVSDTHETIKAAILSDQVTTAKCTSPVPAGQQRLCSPPASPPDGMGTGEANATLDPAHLSYKASDRAPQLSQRGRSLQQGSLTAKMLLGRLSDYTRLMADGKHLPPFIHPHCSLSGEYLCQPESSHLCSTEALSTCTEVLRHFYSSAATSRALVWQRMCTHLQRMYDEVSRRPLVEPCVSLIILSAQKLQPTADLGSHASSSIIWYSVCSIF